MRTTIDLPDDLHARLRSIARDTKRPMSGVAVELIRRGLEQHRRARIVKGRSGFPALTANGNVITIEDVRSLEDEW